MHSFIWTTFRMIMTDLKTTESISQSNLYEKTLLVNWLFQTIKSQKNKTLHWNFVLTMIPKCNWVSEKWWEMVNMLNILNYQLDECYKKQNQNSFGIKASTKLLLYIYIIRLNSVYLGSKHPLMEILLKAKVICHLSSNSVIKQHINKQYEDHTNIRQLQYRNISKNNY